MDYDTIQKVSILNMKANVRNMFKNKSNISPEGENI